jgi:coiled-coil domain-containing protein 12
LSSDQNENEQELFPKPIFRNYTPKDESLKPGILPKPKLIEIEDEIKDRLESGKPQPLIEKEIDLTTLAPQKIDWDLKRDVDKRLRILEKRTQRAIVELIRDRLKQQKDGDLAELVSTGSKQNEQNKNESEDDDDDDDEQEQSNQTSSSGNFTSSEYEDNSNVYINDKKEISDDEDIY